MPNQHQSRSVAIVGGGLAGLAAAVALCERNWQVDLFESSHHLGGRAGSFWDPQSHELIDHCQHVSMGCCTNLADLCRRTQIEGLFRREEAITFFSEHSHSSEVRATSWLPAPLHLAPSLFGLSHLKWNERRAVASALWRLARTPVTRQSENLSFGQWLRAQRQSERSIEGFWSVILVSALAEHMDRVSYAAARKVFVDGFMASASGYVLQLPQTSLGEVYGQRLSRWLTKRGVNLHLHTPVHRLLLRGERVHQLQCRDATMAFDHFIVAVPWRRVNDILGPEVVERIGCLKHLDQFGSSPITAVHLWFDQPITDVAHAVIVGRLSQWLFNRGQAKQTQDTTATGYYYQVVISASREMAASSREETIDQVQADLASIWPAARQAKLLRSRIVTQRDAVFSVRIGCESARPKQTTNIPNLALAGDWTQTGWPATMEGAVRSGYLAAEGVLDVHGHPARILVDDLPRGWLARRVIRDG